MAIALVAAVCGLTLLINVFQLIVSAVGRDPDDLRLRAQKGRGRRLYGPPKVAWLLQF